MIILFGVVGSGKSEQARRLVAKIKCPYISTSDLLRENLTPQVEGLLSRPIG
jgi:adenylate kinase family enzyme